MKQVKKLLALILALTMILSLSITAFAANDGSVTINNAIPGEKYNIYKVFDLTYSGNGQTSDGSTTTPSTQYNGVAYTYTKAAIDPFYEELVKDSSPFTLTKTTDASTFIVALKDNKGAGDISTFLKENEGKLTKAAEEKTAPAATAPATISTVKWENLPYGYYYVTSSVGTTVTIDSTLKDVVVEDKNPLPTIAKEVKEGETWGDSNDAKIGDTVEFRTTITANKGARNFKLHDQMENGLTLIKDTDTESNIVVKASDEILTKGTHYTIEYDCSDGCDFEITFIQTYLDSITEETSIVVTYPAILNGEAEIYDATNNNTTMLDFGNASHTAWDTTTTKTYKFDIIKTDSANKLLDGAEFELYDAAEGGNKINLVKDDDGTYRPATAAEATAAGFTSAVIDVENGKATVKGLDTDTYWLQETKAPAGYNKLQSRFEVKIEGNNLTTTMAADATVWTEGDGGVHIVNQTGLELPSTGGMGTTIFYVVGSILLVGAAVLLITKKRMSAAQ